MNKFDKVKEYYEEHEREILLMLSVACFGAAIGIVVGDKMSTNAMNRGMNLLCKANPNFEKEFGIAVLRHYGVSCF